MKAHRALPAASPCSGLPGQAPADAVRAARLVLSRRMRVAQGFLAIEENCLAQIRGNEAGVVFGRDPESVHQMRVGLRRLRCAHRLFRDVIQPSAALQKEIDWLSSALSALRDWEVLSDNTLPLTETGAPNDTGLASLRRTVEAIAKEKREAASNLMQSARYARLARALDAWMARLSKAAAAPMGLDDGSSPDVSLKEFADRILLREHQRVLKRGRHAADDDAQGRHRLRIAIKRARYAHEFFQSLYPSRPVKTYMAPLLNLQDLLGQLNDFAVADRLLLEVASQYPEQLAYASFARGYLASAGKQLGRKIGKAWKAFERTVPLR
ncbi:MAG TPA: CHAD domain-containing protein [Noviherbaspirillum sp.]